MIGGWLKITFTNLDLRSHCYWRNLRSSHSTWDWLSFEDTAPEMGWNHKCSYRTLKIDQNFSQALRWWRARMPQREKLGNSLLRVPSQPPWHSYSRSSWSIQPVEHPRDEYLVSHSLPAQLKVDWRSKLGLAVSRIWYFFRQVMVSRSSRVSVFMHLLQAR
jgi:hypothetical protein